MCCSKHQTFFKTCLANNVPKPIEFFNRDPEMIWNYLSIVCIYYGDVKDDLVFDRTSKKLKVKPDYDKKKFVYHHSLLPHVLNDEIF